MRTRAKGTSRAAVLAAGFVALGVTVLPSHAFADVTSGDGGILSGNQIDAPVSAPVDVSGNNVAVAGIGDATSHGGAKVHKRHADGQRTSGAHGIASGNQVNAPISAPVNVCGNSAAVVGTANSGCKGGAKVNGGGAHGGQTTDGSGGVLAGNQLNAPISAPVNVCGNAAAVAGNAVAGCEGGAHVENGGHAGSGQETSGVAGVGSGNQGNVPISAPVDVCGNTVGNGAASCAGGASVHGGGHYGAGHQITDGASGVLSGNQENSPISVPVNACGNAAAVVGHAWAFCEGGAHATPATGGHQHTSGTGGVLAGNQAHAPTKAPADACGNTAALVGIASAQCQDGNGGYPGYSSSPRPLDLLPGTGSHPVLPRVASDLPSVTDLPGQANVLSSYSRAQGGTTPSPATLLDMAGTPSANNLLQPRELPQTLGRPAADGQRTKNGLPGTEGLLGAIGLTQVSDLVVPVAAGQRAQGGVPGAEELLAANGLSQVNGLVLPAAGQRAQGGVPGAEDLPGVNGLAQVNDLVVPVAAGHRTQGGLPGTDGVPVNGELTEVGDLVQAGGLPGVSVVGARRAEVPGADGLLPVDAPLGTLGTLGRPGLTGGLPSMGFSKLVKPQDERAEAVRPGLLDVVLRQDPLAAVTGLVTVNPPVPPAGAGGGAVQQRAGAGQEGPVAVSVLDTRALQDGTGELGAVRNVAADGPIIEDGAGSLWALGASAVLGAVAGVLALARRMLPGGRR
ncbi:chaplin family protein [Actinomadura geliboluensis]|nr:chaplin family protein [Actinomadura geliboluensis]